MKTANIRRTFLCLIPLLVLAMTAHSQTAEEGARAAAMDYIDGTANGNIEQIRRAFHKDAALYAVNDEGGLRRIPIDQYIGYFKPGQKTDRDGKIISLDVVNDAAQVKIEILSGQWKFTDYLLLLKLGEGWKIIHKSFTRVPRN